MSELNRIEGLGPRCIEKLYEELDHKTPKDWLAEVAAVLKNFDETDFRAFLDSKQRLYSSILLATRKRVTEQINRFVNSVSSLI